VELGVYTFGEVTSGETSPADRPAQASLATPFLCVANP
jgi:hypothetical protein